MNLNELKARGALVQSPPVPREVTWQPTDPETGQPVGEPVTFTVYVKRPSAGWLDRARTAAARSANGISYRSALISHAVVFGEKLDEQFTYDEADLLQESLAEALYDAYLAVNAPAPPPASKESKQDAEGEFVKNSEPTPGSGTNSSEPASAVEA
jgi:Phage tail assembly chaperone, TAC